MPPIGETLREARMRQKLDIAEIESRTKIRAKYLRALENEEWGLLPGPTFVKTFLRTYAEEVGVDPHLLVEEYRSQHEGEDELDFQPVAVARVRRRRHGREGPRMPGPPPVGVVLLVLALAVVVGLYILGSNEEDGGNASGGGDATEAQQTETAPARPKPKPRPAAPKEVTVRVTPTVPTYACVDTGAGTENLFEGTLERAQTFRNAREVRLNLGKRSVALRANGKAVEIPPSPEPFGVQVTKSATKEIPEGSRPCAG